MKVMGSILGQGPPWGGAKKVAGSIPGHCASKMKKHEKEGRGFDSRPGPPMGGRQEGRGFDSRPDEREKKVVERSKQT